MIDYKLVRALAMVVREGGFEKGARALHLTQSAVSQRVRLLEDQAGRTLLVRSSPPRPTRAGIELLRHYRRVELLEDDLEQALDPDRTGPRSLAVGVNADSLATWFLDAVAETVRRESILLELRVADQDQTDLLLRDGEVAGCVSARATPLQGCTVVPLGRMVYRLVAAPEFTRRWFPDGFAQEAAVSAPAVIFDRDDRTHEAMLERAFGGQPHVHAHYVPSSERFVAAVRAGLGYGMVPDLQADPFLSDGELVNLGAAYEVPVDLFWHSWNIDSALLDRFATAITTHARAALGSPQCSR